MPPKTPKIPLRRRIEESPSAPTMTTPMVVEVSSSEMLENPESSISGTGSPSRSPSPDGITENALEETRIRKRVTDESPSARKKGNQISTTNTESDTSNETSSNSTRVSVNQQPVYHRGQPTAIPIVLYHDTKREVVQQCIANLTSQFHAHYEHEEVIAASYERKFHEKLCAHYPSDKAMRMDCKSWKSWPRLKFVEHLKFVYPQLTHVADKTFLAMIKELKFVYDLEKPEVEDTFLTELSKIKEHYDSRTEKEELDAVKLLIDKINVPNLLNWQTPLYEMAESCDVVLPLILVEDFHFVLQQTFAEARKLKLKAMAFNWTVSGNSKTRNVDQKWVSNIAKTKNSNNSDPNPHSHSSLMCTICGKTNHTTQDCRTTRNEFANHDNRPYVGSESHTKLVKAFGSRDSIPNYHDLQKLKEKKDGSSKSSEKPLSTFPLKSENKKDWKNKGLSLSTILPLELPTSTSPNLVPVSFVSSSHQEIQRSAKAEALLDTGCLAGDFVARRVVDKYHLSPIIHSDSHNSFCSGLDNTCYDMSKSIALTVTYFNERLNNHDTFNINANILDASPIDMIIGRASIKKHSLVLQIPSQFENTKVLITEKKFSENVVKCCGCQPKEDLQPSLSVPQGNPLTSKFEEPAVSQTSRLLASLVLESEQLSGVPLSDEDEIDHDKTDMFKPWLPTSSNADILSLIHISGDKDLQLRLRALCTEFADVFSNELPQEPAKIPPFNLVVDDLEWKVSKNRAPPRQQSIVKQIALFKTLQTLISQGIVEKSQSPHYSQILMVPKPDGTFRMCVDYRALNDCTSDASWPIPNIAEMLRRIGNQKPKIFGIMDLTQGYHQAPLTYATRAYTAFITFSGVYQFTRLPFGPKRAPSYFQEIMATVVLAGLMYMICEMYIDDCNVFADNNIEFVSRLRQILERFRKHNLYLKASKCFFGYSEIEFVGKVVSEEGLKVSQKKIQSVLDFPLPTVSKQLKSFLGTANYLRDFVRGYSTISQPLHQLLTDYNKTRRISWTPESTAAYHEMKLAISKCTTMHFLSDTAPITLHTDASDYGVGGYLFQTVDGKDQPVAFVSKSLNKSQLRWSVIQKEAYGIFYSCMYLQSLLRDRLFTIRTDHRNLLFITEASNPMIVRWYMALSEFSFTLEFIPGIDNNIADSLSRLCRNNMIDSPKEYSKEYILSALSIESHKPSALQYSKIGKLHNSNVGHFGLERTLKRFKNLKDTWVYQRQHVRYFIDNCPCCQKMNMLKIPIHAHGFTTSTYTPMECLNIDFIGPFPDQGYILVIVCTFTRWVELYHTIDATAISAAECLLKHFGRFGAPHQLRSDNGPHFIADVIHEFLALVGVKHCLTLAYSKEENAIVERYNKEINRHLRALTFDNLSLKDYKLSLPFVQRILNSNHSDRLKISASQMLFGNMLNLDKGLFLPKSELLASQKPLSSYMSNLLSIQDNLLKASAKELLRTDLLHMTNKEQNIHKEYLPNSYVLVHYRTGLPPTRLHTFWRGPMRVIKGFDSRYTLLDLITGKEKDYHVSDMKPFIFDSALVDPLDIARRDHMEFFVEKNLDHRGNIKRRKEIEFQVRWLGYDVSNDSWEPYANLRDSEHLHAYLLDKNLTQLIPSKYR